MTAGVKRAVAVLALVLAVDAGALDRDEAARFAARRKALMARIGNGVALLAGAEDTRAYVPFRQDNNFYYLTGVETPGAFLLLDASEGRSILLLREERRRMARWEGERLQAGGGARDEIGVEEILDVSRLEGELAKRVQRGRALHVPMRPYETAATSRDRAAEHDALVEKSPWDGRVSREKALEAGLRKKLGSNLILRDLSPVLDSMRRVKDESEIGLLREAARIAVAGMRASVRRAGPGVFEYQLAALAELVFRWEGASGPSYFTIVGSGPNSCFIHYHRNERAMEAGDIVVMDAGPDYRYYQSDITRTFPVSTAFSEEQREVYQVILDAQRASLRLVRPGAMPRDIEGAARAVVDRAGYGKYWMHAVSHYVGMAVHDVGDASPLEPGVVLTVEPGVYIRDKQIGVRIEDTVLVTRDGHENLTRGVPVEPADIEALRRSTASEVPPSLEWLRAPPPLR